MVERKAGQNSANDVGQSPFYRQPERMQPCGRKAMLPLFEGEDKHEDCEKTGRCDCAICHDWYVAYDALEETEPDSEKRAEVADLTTSQGFERRMKGRPVGDALIEEKAQRNCKDIREQAERVHNIYIRLRSKLRLHPYYYDDGEEARHYFQVAYDRLSYVQDDNIRMEVAETTARQFHHRWQKGRVIDDRDIRNRARTNLARYYSDQRRQQPLETLNPEFRESGDRRYGIDDAPPVDFTPYVKNPPEYNTSWREKLWRLTLLEQETLRLAMEGMNNAAIAKEQDRSIHAVEETRRRLRKKIFGEDT